MTKSLFITFHYPPDTAVATLRVQGMCRMLANAGFPPDVVTATAESYDGNDPVRLERVKDIFARRLTTPNQPVRWIVQKTKVLLGRAKRNTSPADGAGIASLKGKGGVKAVLRRLATITTELPDDKNLWGVKAFFCALRLCRSTSYAFVISSAPPHSVSIVAYFISKVVKIPLILDYRDPWTLSPTSNSHVNCPQWLRNVFISLERQVLNRATLVIVSNDRYAECLKGLTGLGSDKVLPVYNGFDPDILPKGGKDGGGNKLHFRIAHFGTLYLKRNPLPFFHAVERLLKAEPVLKKKVSIAFYGNSDFDLSEMESLSECAGITRVYKPIPHGEALKAMMEADLLLAFAEDQPMQIPAKLFEYIGLNKPILLLGSEGASSELIDGAGCGCRAPISDVDTIAETLKKMIEGGAERYSKYDNSRYAREKQLRILEQRLTGLFHDDNGRKSIPDGEKNG